MVKTNFARINQAMGFQRSQYYSSKQKVQPLIPTEKNDHEMDGVDCSIINTSRISDPLPLPSLDDPFLSHSATYSSWLVDHPSALSSFDRMMKAAKGKKIAVFLDYDGTLSPIVDDPDRAFISDEMRTAVREVAKCFPTAIISGRGRDKVKEFLKLSNVYYAGSHGMDIMAPPRPVKISCDAKYNTLVPPKKGNEVLFQPAKRFLPVIKEIITELEDQTRKIQGARVEDNRFCISVHFRQVREEDYGLLQEKVKSVLKNYPDFHFNEGRKVMEIRPSIDWNKGNALEYLLETLGLSNSNDVLPLYIGDDRTDEDAFKVIEKRGQGYPIIVSSMAKETKASYSLHDPSEVLAFLLRLARWRRSSFSSSSSSSSWTIPQILGHTIPN